MIELYLDECMRERLLKYDIERSEMTCDNCMYYISNTESQILSDIIDNLDFGDIDLLKELGFKEEDIDLLFNYDITIKFTNEDNYYIHKCV